MASRPKNDLSEMLTMNRYRKGYYFEKRVKAYVSSVLSSSPYAGKCKFYAIEARGSHGLVDMIFTLYVPVTNTMSYFGIQAKTNPPPKSTLEYAIKKGMEEHGLPVIYAFRNRNKITFMPDLQETIKQLIGL